jgi:hypothetical protein
VAFNAEAFLRQEKERFLRVFAFGQLIAVKFAVFLRIARPHRDG